LKKKKAFSYLEYFSVTELEALTDTLTQLLSIF